MSVCPIDLAPCASAQCKKHGCDTVTVMKKDPTGDESARVFWPEGSEWVSAEPRRATAEEVRAITQHALQRWFR